MRSVVLLLTAVLATQGGGGFAAGERAFGEGRFEAAAVAFAAEVAARGDAAPAELHYDLALAWLNAGEVGKATAAIERAAATADPALLRRCAFVRGSIAWQRGAAATRLAQQVEAEPFAVKPALQQVDLARREWQAAAVGDPDWPEARRNVERALRQLAELQALQGRLEEARRRAQGAQERPLLVPNGTGDQEGQGTGNDGKPLDAQDNPLAPLRTELSAQAVENLFRVLDQKDRQKRELRRAQQTGAGRAAERDW